MDKKELLEKAKDILYTNDIDGYSTKPSPRLYPHQWLWDSCFIAIGYSHFDIDRAKNEIRGLLRGQQDDGFIPHIRYNTEAKDYFPSANDWGFKQEKNISGITQPPLLAEACRRIYEKDEDKEFLKEVFPKIKKYHEFLRRERGGDLLFIIHPWESGLDNSPVYYDILDNFKIKNVYFKRMDTGVVPACQRPLKKRYDQFFYLMRRLSDLGYDADKIKKEGEFAVEDSLFNSIWKSANDNLGFIARALDKKDVFSDWAKETKKIFKKRLKQDHYFSRDIKKDLLLKKISCVSLMPLYAGIPSKKEAKEIIKLLDKLSLNYPVCTFDPGHKDFRPKRYWRGSSWININWFLIKGLRRYGYERKAFYIKKKTIDMILKNGFFEYFHPKTGQGCGSDDFSWTAALLIDLIYEKNDQ